MAFSGWSYTFLPQQGLGGQTLRAYSPQGQVWIWLQKASGAGMEGASGPQGLREVSHRALLMVGWRGGGEGKWSSIILPRRNQTVTFSVYIVHELLQRSTFLRTKLYRIILIIDRAHWIDSVPSQQSEVILVILEPEHSIATTSWTKSNILWLWEGSRLARCHRIAAAGRRPR